MAESANPILKQAHAEVDARAGAQAESMAEFRPRIEAGGSVSRNNARISGFRPQPIEESFDATGFSVRLTQSLFDGEDWAALKQADKELRAARFKLEAVRQDLLLRVAAAYFQVLKAQADAKAIKSDKRLLKSALEQAKAFREVGTGDVVSVQEAQARFDAAKADSIRARHAITTAEYKLERLTQNPVTTLKGLDRLKPRGPQPDAIHKWIAVARERQPRLLEARASVDAAHARVTAAERARWPDVDLNAGYLDSEGDFAPGLRRREGEIGIRLSFPLYLGGGIQARVKQARAQRHASQWRLSDIKDQIRLETEQAFLNLKNSVSELKAARQALKSAKTAQRATRRGYEVGTRSIVDVTTRIKQRSNAQRNLTAARYRHVLARLELKAAAGVLGRGDLESINALLRPESSAGGTSSRSADSSPTEGGRQAP